MTRFLAMLALAVMTGAAGAADLPKALRPGGLRHPPMPIFEGRVSVIDGHTLWYPQFAQKVRLLDIDTCELPQWALDPDWRDRHHVKSPAPVPCGPIAKAWLKRTIANMPVRCATVAYDGENVPLAFCTAGRLDLGTEMLRVGWARLSTADPARPEYRAHQQRAMAARYGMWRTYVLDMDEWRRKAVDKSLDRRPIADFNLLSERQKEISPPFRDARKRSRRTDR